jgi:hypothetical protein
MKLEIVAERGEFVFRPHIVKSVGIDFMDLHEIGSEKENLPGYHDVDFKTNKQLLNSVLNMADFSLLNKGFDKIILNNPINYSELSDRIHFVSVHPTSSEEVTLSLGPGSDFLLPRNIHGEYQSSFTIDFYPKSDIPKGRLNPTDGFVGSYNKDIETDRQMSELLSAVYANSDISLTEKIKSLRSLFITETRYVSALRIKFADIRERHGIVLNQTVYPALSLESIPGPDAFCPRGKTEKQVSYALNIDFLPIINREDYAKKAGVTFIKKD